MVEYRVVLNLLIVEGEENTPEAEQNIRESLEAVLGQDGTVASVESVTFVGARETP